MPADNLLPTAISQQIKEFRLRLSPSMVASRHCLPIIIRTQCISRGGTILVFTRKWKKRHGVLPRRNGFGLLGLLGFGWHEADREVAL